MLYGMLWLLVWLLAEIYPGDDTATCLTDFDVCVWVALSDFKYYFAECPSVVVVVLGLTARMER
jgi:hypothetical protein